MKQVTSNILLIRPANFGFNVETAVSNAFQQIVDLSAGELRRKVNAEFENFSKTLSERGINVIVAEDTPHPVKPDAVFPNNWISFHACGTAVLYPMCTPNRRMERRKDVVEQLSRRFKIKDVIDFSEYEKENKFMEGTGSIVFDHEHKVAYACLSPRTNKEVLYKISEQLGYEPLCFTSQDQNGKEIYHTNVMMSIGPGFAVVCLDSVINPEERKALSGKLKSCGLEIIEINFLQVNNFAGNMLSVKDKKGSKLLVCSQRAADSLTNEQKKRIETYCELLAVPIPTIETIGGGSARCMMAEIFCEEH